MSDKARALIKQAAESHEKDDGSSKLGKYRDIITEVMHLAYNDPDIIGEKTRDHDLREDLKNKLCLEGFSVFEEELQNAELGAI